MKKKSDLLSLARLLGIIVSVSSTSLMAGSYFTTALTGQNLHSPSGVAVDSGGNVYVSNTDEETVFKITPTGVATVFAGSSGVVGSRDDVGLNAQFSFPQGLAVDASGNIYVADSGNNSIRKITPLGVVSTFATGFNLPYGVAVDGAGNVFVADTFNNTICKVTPGGAVTVIAGLSGVSGNVDGTGSVARFNRPCGVSVDNVGNVYVADSANHIIRKINSAGTVTTLAGGLAGSFGFVDGVGRSAKFAFPHGITVDNAGYIFIADSSNNAIRKISPSGAVTTVAGATTSGDVDGIGYGVRLWSPYALAVDASRAVYVADTLNNKVKKAQVGLEGCPDFNGDGKADILWEDTSDGSYSVWLMNGTSVLTPVNLGVVPPPWHMVATADFNGDGKTDILWEDSVGGSHGIWLMDGTSVTGWVDLGIVPPPWHMIATADFNGDGKADILWEDTTGGSHGIWLMNGTSVTGWVDLGIVPPPWHMVTAADFNGDGKADILWEDTTGGSHGIWLMNGTSVTGWVDLGIVPPPWHMVSAADFNGDGKADIVWENSMDVGHGFWLMNGTSVTGWADLALTSPSRRLVPSRNR